MSRSRHRLSALAVERASTPGRIHDGGGLYLKITPSRSKSWVFRYVMDGRRPEMGLGPYPAISLAKARELAAGAGTAVKTGHDPIGERKAAQERRQREQANRLTFDQVVAQFVGSQEATWRNQKHRDQWRSTLATYASPVLGTMAVADVTTADIMRVLEPIWTTKPETASRLRGRMERVLDYAKVMGARTGENPARWRGHLDKVLPAPSKVRKVKHHAAVAIDELPAVYEALCRSEGMAAKALRFAILTAARAGEVAGATWAEIDLEEKVWTVPEARMKAGRPHRVPLSSEAVAILRERSEARLGDLVFPGWRDGRPLSLASLSKALKTAGGGDATVHGFRSTFRDWTSERTDTPRDVAEMALAHAIEDKVEAAYRRGELMTKRALLMERWATFAATPRQAAEVVALHRVA